MMSINFLNYKLTTQLPDKLGVGRCIVANTLNPHSFCVARNDEMFRQALLSSEILVPDGIGIVYAAKWLYGKRIKKISGYDLHLHFLDLLNRQGGKVFYLGSTDYTLTKIDEKIRKAFPNIIFSSYSPTFCDKFSSKENTSIVQLINEFSPDVLFVGLTAPKQEKWIIEHREQLDVSVIAAIGAVFDFYAGTVNRPGPIWINMGLEWLLRLIREPRRLWRRTLISTPQFLFLIFGYKIRIGLGLGNESKNELKIQKQDHL
jgi:N-acetylglucosaminyldiphosphoundecaprenol N-acetyl-beta-D-mannosaminyltransferase